MSGKSTMKITQEADYALRMVCTLARRDAVAVAAGDEDPMPAAPVMIGATALTQEVAVPTRFGLKILHRLAEDGVLAAGRGATGGYYLAVHPEVLTVRRIIEAIDGPITISRCLSDSHRCLHNPVKDHCRLHHVFGELNDLLTERLDRLTVSAVVDESVSLDDLLVLVR